MVKAQRRTMYFFCQNHKEEYMAVMYYDVCDDAYKLDKDTFKLTILRRTEDG